MSMRLYATAFAFLFTFIIGDAYANDILLQKTGVTETEADADPDRRAVMSLVEQIKHEGDLRQRWRKEYELGSLGYGAKDAVPYLAGLLKNNTNPFFYHGKLIENNDDIEAQNFKEDASHHEQIIVVGILRKIDTPEAKQAVDDYIAVLKMQLLKGDVHARRVAAESLGEDVRVNQALPIPAFMAALHDPDPLVRFIVADSFMYSIKNDPSPEIQHTLMDLASGPEGLTLYKDRIIKSTVLDNLLNCQLKTVCNNPIPELRAYLVDATQKDPAIADNYKSRIPNTFTLATPEEKQKMAICEQAKAFDPLAHELSPRNMIVMADGTMMALGKRSEGGSDGFIGVAHYNTDYTIDMGFRKKTLAWWPQWGYSEMRIIVQSGDRFILGGDYVATRGYEARVMALLPSGALDPTFGKNGVSSFDTRQFESFGNAIEEHTPIEYSKGWSSTVNAVAIGSRKEIYAGGDADHYPFIARLTPDGANDRLFGTQGAVKLDILPGQSGSIYGLVITPGNKLVALGVLYIPPAQNSTQWFQNIVLAKFDADGRPDKTFGNNGVMIKESPYSLTPSPLFRVPMPIVVQTNGKIAFAVSTERDGILLFRFLPNGQPDLEFGAAGQVKLDMPVPAMFGGKGHYGQGASAINLRESGDKLVVAGLIDATLGYTAFAQRLDTRGVKDVTYGNQGSLMEIMGNVVNPVVALDNNDRLIALSENKARDLKNQSNRACSFNFIVRPEDFAPSRTTSAPTSTLDDYKQQCERALVSYVMRRGENHIEEYVTQNQDFTQKYSQYLMDEKKLK